MASCFTRIALAVVLATCIAGPGAAQEDEKRHRFSDDVYAAGMDVRITEAEVDDVFAAGETVTVETDVRGSMHVIGRQITVSGNVGDDLYSAGYSVDVRGTVSGRLVAAGYRVEISSNGSVGDDALLGGRLVFVRGPITGDASLGGETVEIAAPISGSVETRASQIRFGEGARIDGTLAYWSEDPVEVPASVIDPERVTANVVARAAPIGVIAYVVGGVVFVLVVLALCALFAWLLNKPLARARASLGERPWWTLLLGVVAISALIGSVPVLGVSIVGIPLVPVVVVLIPIALIAGYLTTAYVLGRLALSLTPIKLGTEGLATFVAIIVGLVALAILGLIPILGWVLAVLAGVIGLGSWIALFLRRGQPATAAPS